MKVKGWQLAVIVLGFIVSGVSIALMLNTDEPILPHQYHAIDVETGEIFRIDSKRYALTAPAPHPVTGRLSLITISKDEHGHWLAHERNLALLDGLQPGIKNVVLNPESGELLVEVKEPVEYRK